jgi:putative two-component system response regulator
MDKSTILIIDDTPANLKTLSSMLKEEYRIIIAKSGEEGLRLIREGLGPNLILLDIVMPGMDGYEVCKELKSDPETREIPVLFITAKDTHEDKQKGLSLGAAAYITKPFDAVTVRQIVKTHIWLTGG